MYETGAKALLRRLPPAPKGNHRGRKKGVPNFHTKIIKDAALIACELSRHSDGRGLIGYLTFLADQYPQTFTRSILAKLLPIQLALRADVTQRVETVDEVRARLKERGIPVERLAHIFEVPQTPAQVVDMLPRLPARKPNGDAA